MYGPDMKVTQRNYVYSTYDDLLEGLSAAHPKVAAQQKSKFPGPVSGERLPRVEYKGRNIVAKRLTNLF